MSIAADRILQMKAAASFPTWDREPQQKDARATAVCCLPGVWGIYKYRIIRGAERRSDLS